MKTKSVDASRPASLASTCTRCARRSPKPACATSTIQTTSDRAAVRKIEDQHGRNDMKRRTLLGLMAAAALGLPGGAMAQDTVKVGLILPMTGQQASTGKQIKAAVDLYMAENGATVAGKKIEVI